MVWAIPVWLLPGMRRTTSFIPVRKMWNWNWHIMRRIFPAGLSIVTATRRDRAHSGSILTRTFRSWAFLV